MTDFRSQPNSSITCYEQDEIQCSDPECLRAGCRIRNEAPSRVSPVSDVLAGLAERLDRLCLTSTEDGRRFILATESAHNIVGIVREWIRSRGHAQRPEVPFANIQYMGGNKEEYAVIRGEDWRRFVAALADTSTVRARPTIIGRVTGAEYEGDQVPGMPGAICHACGLKDYPCVNPDCPNRVSVSSPTGNSK